LEDLGSFVERIFEPEEFAKQFILTQKQLSELPATVFECEEALRWSSIDKK
jgi:hypothetical protein